LPRQSLIDIDGKEGSTHRFTSELSSTNPEENSWREAITAFLPSCKHHYRPRLLRQFISDYHDKN
jgi:hypothetical protein